MALVFCVSVWVKCISSFAQENDSHTELESAKAALAEFRKNESSNSAPNPLSTALAEWLGQAVTAAEMRESLKKELSQATEALRKAQEELAGWKGFSLNPPYPVALLDAAREDAEAARQRIESAEVHTAQITASLTRLRRELEEASASSRRFEEAAFREKDPSARTEREIEVKTELARARALAIQIGLMNDQLALGRLRVEQLRAERDLAEKKIQLIGNSVRLSEKDLEAILTRLSEAAKELDRRRSALQRTALRDTGELARQAGMELKLLDLRSELIKIEGAIWQRRADYFAEPEVQRKEAQAFIKAAKQKLAAFSRELEEGSGAAFSSANAARARLRAAHESERMALEQQAERAERVVALHLEALQASRSAQKAVDWFRADMGEGDFTAATLAADVSSTLWDILKKLWQTELYAVEDTLMVDGKKVTGSRGITIGKIIFVLAVLASGYLLLRWATLRLERTLAKRLSLAPEHSALARRWILSIGVFVLVLTALHSAGIPLTAFAFLGGALAIGVGFAMQNLIRNFISGLIILFERPFRVNDILSTGSVEGRVTTIGLRASVIRHWNGIETLIPNSTLLEGNVTNWTLSDRFVRDTIKVGLAYGCDPQVVSEILSRCVLQHGEVLKEPPPKIYFDDFGESSLVFRVDYWTDFGKASRLDVASNLRFMIAKAFAAAGLEIAYPTRNMHLATDKPLTIRLEPPEATPSPQTLRPIP